MSNFSVRSLSIALLFGAAFSAQAMEAPEQDAAITTLSQEEGAPQATAEMQSRIKQFWSCVPQKQTKAFLKGFVSSASRGLETALHNLTLYSADQAVTFYNTVMRNVQEASSAHDLVNKLLTLPPLKKESAQPLQTFGRINAECFIEAHISSLSETIMAKFKSYQGNVGYISTQDKQTWTEYGKAVAYNTSLTSSSIAARALCNELVLDPLNDFGLKYFSIKHFADKPRELHYKDASDRLWYLEHFWSHLLQGVENLAHNLTIYAGEQAGRSVLEKMNEICTPRIAGFCFDRKLRTAVDGSVLALTGGAAPVASFVTRQSAQALKLVTGSQFPVALLDPTTALKDLVLEQLAPTRELFQGYMTTLLHPLASAAGAISGAEAAAYLAEKNINGVGKKWSTQTLAALKSFYNLPETTTKPESEGSSWISWGITKLLGDPRENLKNDAIKDAQHILNQLENIQGYPFLQGSTTVKRESNILKYYRSAKQMVSYLNPRPSLDEINLFEGL